jgi:hypothetical protein
MGFHILQGALGNAVIARLASDALPPSEIGSSADRFSGQGFGPGPELGLSPPPSVYLLAREPRNI